MLCSTRALEPPSCSAADVDTLRREGAARVNVGVSVAVLIVGWCGWCAVSFQVFWTLWLTSFARSRAKSGSLVFPGLTNDIPVVAR